MTQSTSTPKPALSLTKEQIAHRIEHTLLKPIMTLDDLKKLCDEAREYHFEAVCIPPTWVKIAANLLKGTAVKIVAAIAFPLGYTYTDAKVLEAQKAVADGATEIDMVINLTDAKNESWTSVEKDIAAVVKACGAVPVKAIIETAYLNTDEKVRVSHAAEKAGAKYIATSTGFAMGVHVTGATVEDIALLRKNLKSSTLIKASGGIRDHDTALGLLAAGADRLGTSSGMAILKGLK